jgi:ribosome-binding protein aMBF1 (putative translation factor)
MKTHIDFQMIKQAGKPAFVVIPYDDFIRFYPEAEKEDGIPHEVVRNMVHNNISRIRAWREHLGFTQKEIAGKIGVSQAALSQIESVGAKPRKPTLAKLAMALGVTSDQLY